MLRMHRLEHLLQVAIFIALAPLADSQDQHTKGAILQRLEARMSLLKQTMTSPISPRLDYFTMKKDNLILVGMSSGSVCPNTYKDGRITQGTAQVDLRPRDCHGHRRNGRCFWRAKSFGLPTST